LETIQITVDFKIINSHAELIAVLSPAFIAQSDDIVDFEIDLNSYSLIYSDHLLLIVSVIDYLRAKSICVEGKISGLGVNPDRTNYASRVDFFKHLGAPFVENFERHEASGKFTEIRRFDNETSYNLFNEIMRILIANDIDKNVLATLHYCLWEVIDNTLNHSSGNFIYGEGHGFACAQYFPVRQEIRILIADNGVGVHHALSKHPNSEYKNVTEEEAVWICVDKNVTNSAGMGFGLWATAEMIKENAGELIVYSGNYQLNCQGEKQIEKKSFWQGTFTFLRINTNIPVDPNLIFAGSKDQFADYQEYKENLFGDISELW
jgi:hypothetical protein